VKEMSLDFLGIYNTTQEIFWKKLIQARIIAGKNSLDEFINALEATGKLILFS
jgi:hypothetical protein